MNRRQGDKAHDPNDRGMRLTVNPPRVVVAPRLSGTPPNGVGIVWIMLWWCPQQHTLAITSHHHTTVAVCVNRRQDDQST